MHAHSSSALSKDGHSFRIPAKLTLKNGHCQHGQNGQDGHNHNGLYDPNGYIDQDG